MQRNVLLAQEGYFWEGKNMWRKELPRKLAGMLAAILVLTSLQIVPVEKVYAEGNTNAKTYTMNELTVTDNWDVSSADLDGGGKELTFNGN